MKKQIVKAVFAYGKTSDPNVYAFGLNGGLPWKHVREDMEQFRKDTTDCVLIMGSGTYKSLPCKLSNRIHVVLSDTGADLVAKNGDKPDYIFKSKSLQHAIQDVKNMYENDIAIIGGIGLIKDAIRDNLVDVVYSTYIALDEYDHDISVTSDELADLYATKNIDIDRVTINKENADPFSNYIQFQKITIKK